jgi:hypothetical protein
MQHRDEEIHDLQRMPGTRRTSHTPARIDTTVHTPDKPFCYDSTCICHSDQKAIQRVQQWVEQGLMTPDEATNYISGRTF